MTVPVLVFDIETIPDVDGIRRVDDLPATLTDTQVAEHAFAARREKTGSDFLPHHLQRVAAISCVFRDGQGFRVRSLGTPEDGEARLIDSFYRTIEKYSPQLVSWNGGGFDLPVLHYRALVHGIRAVRYWETGEEDREFKWNNYLSRYHTRHTDLMDVLAMYQPRANAPLDALAKLCGFPGKLGMDGGQVWTAFQEGRIEEIRNYCETDVVNTYLLYCRFQMMRGGFTEREYADEIEFVKQSLAAETAPHWGEYLKAFAS
ncbi:3'-5' exonuclease [Paraburkholderia guartelaensis]|uniref:3'-5' exonuclease n=1 Tax=Paraburkholderia guartelaensis TaxID=2546446 RepID=A0A4V2ZVX2_9BURK|nr:3'-5' exonuclease [Paraburkholderia guartelaensis]TDG06920.1 3'-5' exonuclease [Paraburkholderia guartelaensis]